MPLRSGETKMGYTTDFSGSFEVTPALNPAQVAYLQAFNNTRRMVRDKKITETRPDPVREAVGLPVGAQGGYFVGAAGDNAGQEDMMGKRNPSTGILDHNGPPSGQPGLWCQWTAIEAGTEIEWDGGEKFYDYIEWMKYIVEHFLKPWGCVVNGEITWVGEDSEDRGRIKAVNNKIFVATGATTYGVNVEVK